MPRYRVKQYEVRVTRTGRKLYVWRPLERGGRALAAAVELTGRPTMAELMGRPEVQAVLLDKVRTVPIQLNLGGVTETRRN